VIFLIDRIVRSPSKLYLEEFIKNGLENKLKLSTSSICIPEVSALKDDKTTGIIDKNISYEKCKGCLCCVEKEDSNGLNKVFQPMYKSSDNYTYEFILKNKFKNIFDLNNQLNNFVNYYSKSEVRTTTPIACHILYRLSKMPNKSFFRSDPYATTNINTPDDPRDGKLDLVIFNANEKKILIIEVKKDLKSLFRDKKRDQWNKYQSQIQEISNKYKVKSTFFFLIGGQEEEIYPINSLSNKPIYDQRVRFYKYMKNKKFVSLNFLYTFLMLSLVKNNIYWEDIFFNDDYKGLLSTGYINDKQMLKSFIF
jgi:hypothetical protein